MEESKLKIGLDARKGFFHVMLSYRVTPDADFVTKIHDKLHLLAPTAGKSVSQVNQLLDSSDSPFPEGFRRDESTLNSSLHVFQDYYCLRDGVGWEGDGGIKSGGFVGALRLSAVFVPIFSATDIVTENSESAQKRSGKGSVGQMIKLAHEDVQDNVLLELIVARELHLISRTINKTNGNKVLSPCSYIIPLFRQDVWACKAVDFLPETASAITNAKAKNVMKLMEVPDEAISPELRNGTLTVRAVWEFFLQFQGKKLYEHGKENFQVVAAANAIISVIDGVRQFVAESKFDDLKMNSSQMHELSNFLLQLNMSNYTAIFASHQITNVFQLAEMKQPISDALVLSIAQYGVRESDNSTLPVELSKIGAAIRAAQSSPLATSLNVRLRNFIDRDASFVTLLSSSSLFDLVLSKKFSALSVFLIMSIILIDQVSRLVSPDIIPNRPRIHRHLDYFASTVPNILAALACLIAVFHSPRKGRFCLAFAFLNWASIVTVMFAVGAYSAIYENCANCYGEARILNQLTTVQRIGVQPTWFLMYWGLFFCSLFKQQWTFPVLFLAQIINILIYYPSLGSLAIEFLEGSGFYVYVFTWFSFFVLLSFLQYIGNRRAGFIFELNSRAVEGAYQTLLRDEISKSSQFGKLCSNQQPSQEYEMRPYPHVVYVSDSEQHSTIQGQCVDAPLVTPTPAGHSAPSQTSVKSQKIISIENMFKTEYTLHGELLQVQHSFEQLIQDAEFINDAFQVWVSCWLIGGPDLDVVHKYLHQPAQFKDLIERTSAPIKGICIRGPLKHVDRCIAKVRVIFATSLISHQIFLDFAAPRV
jgi:hypothetical protein